VPNSQATVVLSLKFTVFESISSANAFGYTPFSREICQKSKRKPVNLISKDVVVLATQGPAATKNMLQGQVELRLSLATL
jgi:hypothetical protein